MFGSFERGGGNGVPVLERLVGGEGRIPCPGAGEVGPVNALGVAVWTADEVVYGNAERFALDVPTGEFDSGNAHLGDSAGHGAEVAVEVEVEFFDGLGVTSYDEWFEVFYESDERMGSDAGSRILRSR